MLTLKYIEKSYRSRLQWDPTFSLTGNPLGEHYVPSSAPGRREAPDRESPDSRRPVMISFREEIDETTGDVRSVALIRYLPKKKTDEYSSGRKY